MLNAFCQLRWKTWNPKHVYKPDFTLTPWLVREFHVLMRTFAGPASVLLNELETHRLQFSFSLCFLPDWFGNQVNFLMTWRSRQSLHGTAGFHTMNTARRMAAWKICRGKNVRLRKYSVKEHLRQNPDITRDRRRHSQKLHSSGWMRLSNKSATNERTSTNWKHVLVVVTFYLDFNVMRLFLCFTPNAKKSGTETPNK